MKLLVVENEVDLNHVIAKNLIAEGYTVDSCYNGYDAIDYILLGDYDAVILDIMLPGKNGYEIIRHIREKGMTTPILCLSAKDQTEDIVKGLDCGADDYMAKPFSFDELLARIRVITRRIMDIRENIYSCGDLILDTNQRTVSRQGKNIILTPKEYSIMEFFVRNKNMALTRQQIESNIWSIDFSGESNIIDVYIRYLRKKIDDGFEYKMIQTVRGVGYMLKCEEE